MNRFLIFPLVLVVVGLLLPLFTYLELAAPFLMAKPMFRTLDQLGEMTDTIFRMTAPYGLGVGLVLGVGAACWDWVYKRGRSESGLSLLRRFLLNLWCGLYAFVIAVINSLIIWQVLIRLFPLGYASFAVIVSFLPLVILAVVNLASLFWAVSRTVVADDVLSPRVLMGKMRRTAKVAG